MDLKGYSYISVPYVHSAPKFGRMVPYTVHQALAANFYGRRCPADRLQLINGVIAYRVLNQYIEKFQKDGLGYYLNLMSLGMFRFTDVDPSTLAKPVTSNREWMPV